MPACGHYGRRVAFRRIGAGGTRRRRTRRACSRPSNARQRQCRAYSTLYGQSVDVGFDRLDRSLARYRAARFKRLIFGWPPTYRQMRRSTLGLASQIALSVERPGRQAVATSRGRHCVAIDGRTSPLARSSLRHRRVSASRKDRRWHNLRKCRLRLCASTMEDRRRRRWSVGGRVRGNWRPAVLDARGASSWVTPAEPRGVRNRARRETCRHCVALNVRRRTECESRSPMPSSRDPHPPPRTRPPVVGIVATTVNPRVALLTARSRIKTVRFTRHPVSASQQGTLG